MNWRERLARFMMGRYGIDAFSKALIYGGFGIYIVNIFLQNSIISYISFGLFIYAYFRIFSRNIYKRSSENQQYLQKTQKIRMSTDKYIRQLKSRKTHHIYKCPTCKQKIRVPKGKGRISIRCPKCNTEFIKKS